MIGLWVAFGGGIGAIARFSLGSWITLWAPAGFPWATFVVNVLGSTLLGFSMRALPSPPASPRTRGFLAIGLCGGFTTFSVFDLETLNLLRQSAHATAAVYSLGSAVFCIGGVWVGLRLAAWLLKARGAPA